MITPNEFVKYYYFLLPRTPANYSATVAVNALTDGFMPSIYLLRNDIINGSIQYENLKFPTMVQNNLKIEPSFL